MFHQIHYLFRKKNVKMSSLLSLPLTAMQISNTPSNGTVFYKKQRQDSFSRDSFDKIICIPKRCIVSKKDIQRTLSTLPHLKKREQQQKALCILHENIDQISGKDILTFCPNILQRLFALSRQNPSILSEKDSYKKFKYIYFIFFRKLQESKMQEQIEVLI